MNGGGSKEEFIDGMEESFLCGFYCSMKKTLAEMTEMAKTVFGGDFLCTNKKYNREGTTSNRFLLRVENICLQAMVEKLYQLGLFVDVLMPDDDTYVETFINHCQDLIRVSRSSVLLDVLCSVLRI
eukprot:TRINITY_DN11794_c0_g1_i1.p1 TRINITY_DN11794_c0_g1~~TRINITY_DN11794_c0_g1_i1.p1  ORF type:complete len:126 (+),score=21.38 TRINITY_DN11794_c0_g1_i1:2-379(+)